MTDRVREPEIVADGQREPETVARRLALRETDGRLSVVQKRSVKAGARALLDRLGDL